MPYDALKARKAIQTANAYERLPGSEFVMQMAKILKEADDEIAGSSEKINAAERESTRFKREADDLRAEVRQLKESTGEPLEQAITVLREIAGGAKGAKAKAAQALAIVSPDPVVSATR